MTKVRIPNRSCGSGSLRIQDEGEDIGTASILDFVGDNVTAVKSGNKVTVTVTDSGGSGGGSDFYRGDHNLTAGSYPLAGTGSGAGGIIQAGDMWRIILNDPNVPVTIGGVEYYDRNLLVAAIDEPSQTTANWTRLLN